MVLEDAGGWRFELRVLGWQFEDVEEDWLDVEIRAAFPRGSWTAVDAALQAADLTYIADWLGGIASGDDVDSELDFVEPNLVFELRDRSDGVATIRVWIEGELRPGWARWDSWDERDLFADFTLDPPALERAAGALREEAKRFPPREPA